MSQVIVAEGEFSSYGSNTVNKAGTVYGSVKIGSTVVDRASFPIQMEAAAPLGERGRFVFIKLRHAATLVAVKLSAGHTFARYDEVTSMTRKGLFRNRLMQYLFCLSIFLSGIPMILLFGLGLIFMAIGVIGAIAVWCLNSSRWIESIPPKEVVREALEA